MPKDCLPVPHYKQSADGQCLPACARMVLAYLGHELTETRVARLLHARSFGTPASNIRYLEQLNLSVIYTTLSLARARAYIQRGIPCIAFIQTAELPYCDSQGFHAVVIVGMDAQQIYVHDPALETGPQAVPLDDFSLAWAEFDYKAAVIFAQGI